MTYYSKKLINHSGNLNIANISVFLSKVQKIKKIVTATPSAMAAFATSNAITLETCWISPKGGNKSAIDQSFWKPEYRKYKRIPF
jgi:malate dehydrogenase (oxaloacetate-decarboxylating)